MASIFAATVTRSIRQRGLQLWAPITVRPQEVAQRYLQPQIAFVTTSATVHATQAFSEEQFKSHNSVISGCSVTIFEKMSVLAAEHDAINLGQGFPDTDGPEDVREIAATTLLNQSNQYPPMMGLPTMRQAVAEHFNAFYDLDVNWQTEALVTAGATEMLAASLFALLEPGDEVIAFEPTYDCYLPLIRRAGAIPVTVPITPPAWELDIDALASAFSPKTKVLLLNDPQNPSGKVFTDHELSAIAKLVHRHNCYAICDEVYEHMVFDGDKHRTLLAFPGMRNRAIKVGSAGKSFSLTGWKVGYGVGPQQLMQSIARAHQFLTFTVPPNLQHAVAYGLRKPEVYFSGLADEMEMKRDRLATSLVDVGFDVVRSASTYFVVADIRPLGYDDDVEFCQTITTKAGVAAVPLSAFYESDGKDIPRHYVRFCCAKRNEVLDAAADRLREYFQGTQAQVPALQ